MSSPFEEYLYGTVDTETGKQTWTLGSQEDIDKLPHDLGCFWQVPYHPNIDYKHFAKYCEPIQGYMKYNFGDNTLPILTYNNAKYHKLRDRILSGMQTESDDIEQEAEVDESIFEVPSDDSVGVVHTKSVERRIADIKQMIKNCSDRIADEEEAIDNLIKYIDALYEDIDALYEDKDVGEDVDEEISDARQHIEEHNSEIDYAKEKKAEYENELNDFMSYIENKDNWKPTKVDRYFKYNYPNLADIRKAIRNRKVPIKQNIIDAVKEVINGRRKHCRY